MLKTTLLMSVSFILFLIASCTSTPTQESTGQFIDSTTLTAKIKASLVDDLGTSGLPVKVKTWKGEVQLSGYVDNVSIKKRAAFIASNVDGVKRVRNNIVVK